VLPLDVGLRRHAVAAPAGLLAGPIVALALPTGKLVEVLLEPSVFPLLLVLAEREPHARGVDEEQRKAQALRPSGPSDGERRRPMRRRLRSWRRHRGAPQQGIQGRRAATRPYREDGRGYLSLGADVEAELGGIEIRGHHAVASQLHPPAVETHLPKSQNHQPADQADDAERRRCKRAACAPPATPPPRPPFRGLLKCTALHPGSRV
jgi:hypothetical protein